MDITVIFLAGGSSSRFFPLKEKNLYSFLGKNVTHYQVEKLQQKLKPKRIIVVANQDNYETVKSLLSDYDNVEVTIQQGQGMSGAVLSGISLLDVDDRLLVVGMNDYYDDSVYQSFVEKLDSGENIIVGYQVGDYFPGGYLKLDEAGYIQTVVEKPGAGNEPSEYVKIVFDYFQSAYEFKRYVESAHTDKDDLYEVALADMMAAGKKFKMLPYSGNWTTIKYPWHVLDVMEYFLSTITKQSISSKANISPAAVIKGNVIIEEGVKVFEGAVISGPAYIGKNTIVGNNSLVRNSIIGEDCVIGYASEVARSYFGDQVWLHKNYIGDSIVEGNVSFGSNSLTANLRLDEGEIFVNVKGESHNTKLTKLGNIIASNVRIGVGALLMPGIKIGGGTFIGSGVVLDRDLDENSFVRVKQELDIRSNKIDITKKNREQYKTKLN